MFPLRKFYYEMVQHMYESHAGSAFGVRRFVTAAAECHIEFELNLCIWNLGDYLYE